MDQLHRLVLGRWPLLKMRKDSDHNSSCQESNNTLASPFAHASYKYLPAPQIVHVTTKNHLGIFDHFTRIAKHQLPSSSSSSSSSSTAPARTTTTTMMNGVQDPEKKALLEKPTIRIRPAEVSDARGVHGVTEYTVKHSPGATLDAVPSLSTIEHSLKAVKSARSPEVIESVADAGGSSSTTTATTTTTTTSLAYPLSDQLRARRILGFVTLVPYSGTLGGKRSCYARTGMISVATLGADILGAELDRELRGALIDDTIARYRAASSSSTSNSTTYKTVVVEVAYREDRPELRSAFDVFRDRGFAHAGTLKGVIEKDGLVIDTAFLQKDL
ncbi:hypothetical protein F4778DRAFT_712247 [Xylariomycetidae sp. FL2044]|nr:hypothetical protein F4778DRAFT_712247 [Xylariomycetidae sp. FL2044]